MVTSRYRNAFMAAAATLILGATMSNSSESHADALEEIDLDGVENVVIHGSGSKVEMNAHPDGTSAVRVIETGRSRLRCGMETIVRRNGGTLDIQLERRGLRVFGQCDLTVAVDLPADIAVSLRQSGTVARLTGDFSDILVESPDAVVTFAGRARNFEVDSDNAVVNLAFTESAEAETVRISAERLVANVGYRPGTRISYDVSAPLSVFTHAFPNTPGAQPRVEIDSRLLKGSIYVLEDGAS